jgi:hypothetical protein
MLGSELLEEREVIGCRVVRGTGQASTQFVDLRSARGISTRMTVGLLTQWRSRLADSDSLHPSHSGGLGADWWRSC